MSKAPIVVSCGRRCLDLRRLQGRTDDADQFGCEHSCRAEQLQRVVSVAQLIGQDDAPAEDQLTQVGGDARRGPAAEEAADRTVEVDEYDFGPLGDVGEPVGWPFCLDRHHALQ